MYTYHSARVVTPLLILGLIIFNRKDIIKKTNLRWIVLTIIISVLLSFPLLNSLRSSETSSRFSGVGIFADQGPYWRANELRGQHRNPFILLPKLLHNKISEYIILFFNNYLKHFDGNYLFISGDEIQRNKIPEMGQLYLIEIPFVILGFYFILNKRPKNWKFIIWWFLIAPVASALTFQSPHAIRSLNMVIPFSLLIGFGLFQAFLFVYKYAKHLVYLPIFLVFILYFYNIYYFQHQYYIHYPKTYPAAWEYGFKELVNFVSQNQDKYKKIYVTNKYDQPYIIFAFYLKYPPSEFQKEAKLTPRDQYGFSTVEHFGKYYFGKIDEKRLEAEKSVMIIGSPEELSNSGKIVKTVYYKDGITEAFKIAINE